MSAEHPIGEKQIGSCQHGGAGRKRYDCEESPSAGWTVTEESEEPGPEHRADPRAEEKGREHEREDRNAIAQVEDAQPGQKDFVSQRHEPDTEGGGTKEERHALATARFYFGVGDHRELQPSLPVAQDLRRQSQEGRDQGEPEGAK